MLDFVLMAIDFLVKHPQVLSTGGNAPARKGTLNCNRSKQDNKHKPKFIAFCNPQLIFAIHWASSRDSGLLIYIFGNFNLVPDFYPFHCLCDSNMYCKSNRVFLSFKLTSMEVIESLSWSQGHM